MRLDLSFRQTPAEQMVRIAASLIFCAMRKAGCKLVSLSSLTEDPQYGYTASAAAEPVGPKLVRITDLQDGQIKWETVPYCDCPEPTRYWLKAGDILFARTGATTGKTHLVESDADAVFASYLIRVRPRSGVSADYLYSFFQSDSYWSQIMDEKEGSAQPNVNGRKLMTILIPPADAALQGQIVEFLKAVRKRQDGVEADLPPLPQPLDEQRRIVKQIESIQSKVQSIQKLTNKADEEIRSLLVAYVNGRLSRIPNDRTVGELLIGKPRNGWSAPCDNADGGIAVLSLGAVSGFEYRASHYKLTSEPTTTDAPYWLRKGDLLMTRSNTPELVGHAAIYSGHPFPCVYPDLMMRLEVDERLADKRFLHRWLMSAPVREFIRHAAKGTSPTMKKISQGVIMQIPFPRLPLVEQQRIADEIESVRLKTVEASRIQKEIVISIRATMPAVLNAAFLGQL
jgi:type I restriction enzyme, S subunit